MKTRVALVVALALAPLQLGRAVGASLPNLTPSRPFGTVLDYVDPYFPQGPRAIRMAVAVANVGEQPLELTGVPQPDGGSIAVQQCVEWVAAACSRRAEMGVFSFEPFFMEWYIDSFVRLELRTLGVDDRPVLGETGLVSTGGRISSCPYDESPNHLRTVEEALSEGVLLFPVCSNIATGLSPGYNYVEASSDPEQYIPVDGVADGRYAVVVRLDATNLIAESDELDNMSYVAIDLYGNGTGLRVIR